MLELHKTYSMAEIEKMISERHLFEKIDGELLEPSDDMPEGVIGEIVMPLYDSDGDLHCNFILTGYGNTSYWRCIYIG